MWCVVRADVRWWRSRRGRQAETRGGNLRRCAVLCACTAICTNLREVILTTPATPSPVGARQRLPRTVHTRTDSTSSHTAAHHHSSSHFPTLHTCIPSISYPRKRIRWPCSDGHAEAMRRAFRGAIARLVGSLAACQCAMPLVFIPIHCVTRKAA